MGVNDNWVVVRNQERFYVWPLPLPSDEIIWQGDRDEASVLAEKLQQLRRWFGPRLREYKPEQLMDRLRLFETSGLLK